MTDLRVGNRIPIFVTHVEFQNSGCQAFVHVGDLGSQADTVVERTDAYVNSGGAEIPSSSSVGDLCLALFHEDNGWYRAQVLSVSGNSVKVFFIDYGNTETVKVDNLRNASDFVLAIPPLTTKCQVTDCIPFFEQWTEEETKKIESMLHSQEFIAEIVQVDPAAPIASCNVKLFKTDEPTVPVFLRKSSSSSDLTVKNEELQIGQDNLVFVSFVDSQQKFWVQLKQKEKELSSLMSDIGACFAEDLPSSGDIVKPVLNQICASCFSEDGSFYRAKVQSVSGDSCKVFFVDYGNSENKSASELFTLPQVLAQLPMQAIQCSYRPTSDAAKIEDILHNLEAEGTSCVIKAVSKASSGYVVQIDAVEKQLNTNQIQNLSTKGKGEGKIWTSLPSVVMQVGSVYDVCISHLEHPGRFYIQLIGNASKLDNVMQSIDEVAHNLDSLIIANPGTLCLAKFSDDAWYRSEIMSADGGSLTVGAIDFGFIEEFSSKQKLRKIDTKFKELPAQSILCSLNSENPSSSDWSEKDVLKFNALAEKTALVCRVIKKSGSIFEVDLFDTTNDQERHINQELAISLNGPVRPTVPNSRSIPNSTKPQMKLPPPETALGTKITLCVTALKSTLVFGQVTNTPVEKVAKLQTDLNDYYDKKSTESLDSVDLGSVCCTQYSDGGWYRGVVTSVQGGQVEVLFADFGDSIMKSKSDLKALVPSLCELPQQCVLVNIENLPSVPGNKLESVLVNKRIDVKLKNKEGIK